MTEYISYLYEKFIQQERDCNYIIETVLSIIEINNMEKRY